MNFELILVHADFTFWLCKLECGIAKPIVSPTQTLPNGQNTPNVGLGTEIQQNANQSQEFPDKLSSESNINSAMSPHATEIDSFQWSQNMMTPSYGHSPASIRSGCSSERKKVNTFVCLYRSNYFYSVTTTDTSFRNA